MAIENNLWIMAFGVRMNSGETTMTRVGPGRSLASHSRP